MSASRLLYYYAVNKTYQQSSAYKWTPVHDTNDVPYDCEWMHIRWSTTLLCSEIWIGEEVLSLVHTIRQLFTWPSPVA